jgi:hypothetical protein
MGLYRRLRTLVEPISVEPLPTEIFAVLIDDLFSTLASEALLYGFLLLQKKIRRTGTIER